MIEEELDRVFNQTIDRAIEMLEKARKKGRVASGLVISVGFEQRFVYCEDDHPGKCFPSDHVITMRFIPSLT